MYKTTNGKNKMFSNKQNWRNKHDYKKNTLGLRKLFF